ncbi:tRNA A64-2'-O-ribosylphosphate transferase [Dipodascopsis uninucleata]
MSYLNNNIRRPDFDDFGAVSKSLRKDSRSMRNRLHSIFHDAMFVKEVRESYGLPLVANERCGRWYISPENIAESVYFKSTDGHTGQWGFSLRRLNLHIIRLITENNGIIIVDSTRRGKRMPDSFSKTIPIWCAVINAAIFESDNKESIKYLFTPPNAVSSSERAQIEFLLPQWIKQFHSSGVDISDLRNRMNCKPLRPLWVTPEHNIPETIPQFTGFYPIVLCTASKMVLDGQERRNGYTYVQGAADDHEEWTTEKLTPDLFWKNKQLMEAVSDGEIEQLVAEITIGNNRVTPLSATLSDEADMSSISNTGIYIGRRIHERADEDFIKTMKALEIDTVIDVSTATDIPSSQKLKVFHSGLPEGKKGSKLFRTVLPKILQFYDEHGISKNRIGIFCDTGGDLSVGIALAIMSLHYDDNGSKLPKDVKHPVNKDLITKRLTTIVCQRKVNPSRATLLSVNSVLMGWK